MASGAALSGGVQISPEGCTGRRERVRQAPPPGHALGDGGAHGGAGSFAGWGQGFARKNRAKPYDASALLGEA